MNRGIKRYRKNRLFPRLPKSPMTSYKFSLIFKELYCFHLEAKDYKKYNLMRNYEDKLSLRLLEEKRNLKELGEAQGESLIKDIVFSSNPLLASLPRPIKFDK